MSSKLLNEHNLDFLSLKGGCTGTSESTLVKIPHCWKSHVTACKVFKNHNLENKLKYIFTFQNLLSEPTFYSTSMILSLCITHLFGHCIAAWYAMSRSLVKLTEI